MHEHKHYPIHTNIQVIINHCYALIMPLHSNVKPCISSGTFIYYKSPIFIYKSKALQSSVPVLANHYKVQFSSWQILTKSSSRPGKSLQSPVLVLANHYKVQFSSWQILTKSS